MSEIFFSREQVMALLNWKPHNVPLHGYHGVEYFKLEHGILQPYNERGILPYPGIMISAQEEFD